MPPAGTRISEGQALPKLIANNSDLPHSDPDVLYFVDSARWRFVGIELQGTVDFTPSAQHVVFDRCIIRASSMQVNQTVGGNFRFVSCATST